MTVCLAEDRMADAFVIANCGGKDLLDKAQAAYLAKKNQGPNYIRLLTSVIGKNLWDVVYNADLADWKDVMATLCTFADPTEFPDLCESLGDRILETGLRKDASFCYLVGSKLEKVVGIWVEELKEGEASGIQEGTEHSTFSVHAKALQNFIEKVTVFREVVKFQDKELDLKSDWALTALYNKYTEYADVVAAQGNLATAEKYLNLLPTEYPAAQTARDRVKLASRKAGAQSQAYQQPATTTRSTSRAAPAPLGYQPPQQQFASATPAANPYQPPTPAPGAGQYAPTNTYAPAASAYAPPNNSYAPPANSYGPPSGYQPPQQQGGYGPPPVSRPPMGGPPRNGPQGPLPAALRKDITPWNDTPVVTKPTPSRRSTPVMPPPSAYGNPIMPPPGPPYGGPRANPTPPPPPPKGSAPPRVNSPMANAPPRTFSQGSELPPSFATNPYAPPPPQSGQKYAAPTVPRGVSPYNAPPSGPQPSNRYAPSPALANPGYGQAQPGSMPPPPPPQGGMRGPPPGSQYAQYAPSEGFPSQPPPQNQYAPSQSPYQPQGGPSQIPPQGLQQGPPQGQGPPQVSRPPTASSQTASPAQPPAKQRLPPGDRSQIPASAQQMVDIFTGEMQRVANKAPASFHAQVKDAQKRLNLLFDHLNNGELVKPDTIQRLSELAQALQAKQYDVAARMQVDIQKEKTEECGNWMVSCAISQLGPSVANKYSGWSEKISEHEQGDPLEDRQWNNVAGKSARAVQ